MTDEAKTAILAYFRAQNRPYSANDVVQNLHKAHGKAAAQRALDMLVADKLIIEKVNGKQKAYVINQDDMPTASASELEALDSQIADTQRQLSTLSDELKSKESQLKQMESSLTTAQIGNAILQLNADIAKMSDKLETLSKQRGDSLMNQEERKEVQAKHTAAVKEWKRRKRMCLAIVEAIMDSYPKPKKALFEEIGIETDEDAGIKMPEL